MAKKRLNRKGMELSINFIVILILSITIFGFGIYLVKEFFGFAEEAQARIDVQTQAEIERRLLDVGDKVAIPQNKAKVRRSDSHTFGLGILNSFSERREFGVDMAYVGAFDTEGNRIQGEASDPAYINDNWIFGSIPSVALGANEHAVVPLTVRVDPKMSDTLSTEKDRLYLFNVCVYKSAQRINCAQATPADVAQGFLHGDQVLKVYVQVI